MRKPYRFAKLLFLVGCLGCLCVISTAAAKPPGTANAAPSSRTVTAHRFARLRGLDPIGPFSGLTGHATSVEGAAFGPGGEFYFTDLSAPPGAPKILRLNMATKKVQSVYTDAKSVFSSVQFSPVDHRLYATDFIAGRIDSMDPDGSGFRTVFAGPVAGRRMTPDDLAFDRDGNMYVTDMTGTPWDPSGRIVRIDSNGTHPSVLIEGLAQPNGISFSPDYSSLWISEFKADREDYVTLTKDHRDVEAGAVGMTYDTGTSGLDSNAVDADGNIYQCVFGAGKVLVWNNQGELLETVVIPQTFPRSQVLSSNIAIEPGTRRAFITVGGRNGAFLYSFKAPGRGESQANGGGATF
jgi:lactonase